jgi:hypothetical protein
MFRGGEGREGGAKESLIFSRERVGKGGEKRGNGECPEERSNQRQRRG